MNVKLVSKTAIDSTYLSELMKSATEADAKFLSTIQEAEALMVYIARVSSPNQKAALSALHTFYSKFEYASIDEGFDELQEHRERPKSDAKPCVIVDIDGTVANLDHRLHYVRDGKKDWRTFLSKCDQDTPNHDVYVIAESYCDAIGADLVFCSGRGTEYRDKTETWLKEFNMPHDNLFMRQERDYRQDTVIKEQILDFEILTRYSEVYASFDDRSSVVEMWRKRGIRCLQVAPGDF